MQYSAAVFLLLSFYTFEFCNLLNTGSVFTLMHTNVEHCYIKFRIFGVT